ncbi:hypothetical protein QJQ45_023576 [Haematococcus lacustris]|nr:hypothetical protein QJQ45_023576 [Haematococcus lacustris]
MPRNDEGDIFDSVLDVEQTAISQGYEAGVSRDGMAAGLDEGRELGLQKGYEIGVEVGFYAGCVRTWRAFQAMQAAAPSPSNRESQPAPQVPLSHSGHSFASPTHASSDEGEEGCAASSATPSKALASDAPACTPGGSSAHACCSMSPPPMMQVHTAQPTCTAAPASGIGQTQQHMLNERVSCASATALGQEGGSHPLSPELLLEPLAAASGPDREPWGRQAQGQVEGLGQSQGQGQGQGQKQEQGVGDMPSLVSSADDVGCSTAAAASLAVQGTGKPCVGEAGKAAGGAEPGRAGPAGVRQSWAGPAVVQQAWAGPRGAAVNLLGSERLEKAIAGLEGMLASFPLDNPQDERLHDLMEKMRGRFKAIVAMLGLIQDYMPRGKLDVSGAAQALARVSSREPEITGTLASEEMAASTRASVSPGADMTF